MDISKVFPNSISITSILHQLAQHQSVITEKIIPRQRARMRVNHSIPTTPKKKTSPSFQPSSWPSDDICFPNMTGHDEVQLQALFADGDRQIFQNYLGTHVSRHSMLGTTFLYLYLYFVNFVDLLFISQFSDFLNSDDAPEFQIVLLQC